MTARRIAALAATIMILFAAAACGTTTTQTTAAVPAEVVLDVNSVTLARGGAVRLGWTVAPATAAVTFVSSDETVAAVTAEGLVTGVAPGSATITVRSGDASDTCEVVVIGSYVLTAPKKSIYSLGDELSLRGGSIAVYDAHGTLIETVLLDPEMIVAWDADAAGEQIVVLSYAGIEIGFPVLVLSAKQAECRFDDFILLTEAPTSGERIEFAFTKADVDALLSAVDNVYDYAEIDLYAYVEAPSGDVKKVSAFWFQDYREVTLGTIVNRNNNLEGTVTVLPDDVAIVLGFVAENDPQYRLRYLTGETGAFSAEVYVKVDGAVVQTFEKTFDVSADPASDYRGTIIVDEGNGRHFAFSEGGTYVPVGQNVAWYTSKDRRYYDYAGWFGKMGDVGMNYARVWMAAWGFSIYWGDVYDYGPRQSAMKSLDATLDLAAENGIYVQLCILHHGMFSETVNPMWPNDENSWYTDKYGANPYAEYLDEPGEFFTSELGRSTFRNQLAYIVARWGYSDHIMAWELFNEVDWIEQYSAVAGNAWHGEMADHLKAIDPYGHLVTTSLKGESFLSSTFNVFKLASIDYVNVHSYGIYDHVETLPVRQKNAFLVFGKPILYDEVGYSGNGGAAQMAADPGNVTLHQELWGGMMGGGAGTGMNWWWESWIHPSDAYPVFAGAAAFAADMDLAGSRYGFLDAAGASVSSAACAILGYHLGDRAYAYVYDRSYDLATPVVANKNGVVLTIPGLDAGSYAIRAYDAETGAIMLSATLQVGAGGTLATTLPAFAADIAVAVERIAG
ncbi:MAG: Ig-like domain-containing protein [Candidatus Izemoplasmatales bacterium]